MKNTRMYDQATGRAPSRASNNVLSCLMRTSGDQGLADVERFIRYVETTRPLGTSAAQDRVTASIIPRFVPSCTSELMSGLGRISNDLQLPVHSHLSESPAEIAWVKELHPQSGYYAQVIASRTDAAQSRRRVLQE